MKKKIILLIFAVISIFTLVSCHKSKIFKDVGFGEESEEGSFDNDGVTPSSTTPTSNLNFDETQTYNLTFWAKNDNNSTQKNIYLNAINKFNEYYPNITITMKDYSDYNEIYKDVLAKTAPNICIAYPDHVATYKEAQNMVLTLDSIAKDPYYGFGGSKVKFSDIGLKSINDVVPSFIEECKIDNKLYMLPYMRSSEALYINKEVVEELGYTIDEYVTWDWLFEVCEKALEKAKADGITKFIPMMYKSEDNMMIQLCKQYGYDYTTSDKKVLFFNDDVANLTLDLGNKIRAGLFDTFKWTTYPGNYYNKGITIFAIDSTAGATWIGTGSPNKDVNSDYKFTTVVRPVPQVDVNNPQMISQGPSICLFNKEDSNVNIASWLFAQFLLTNETQIAYSKTEGYIPVTNKALNSEEYQATLYSTDSYDETDMDERIAHYQVRRDAAKMVIDNVNKGNTFITPVFNGSSDARQAAGYLIQYTRQTKYNTLDKIKNSLFPSTIDHYGLSAYVK